MHSLTARKRDFFGVRFFVCLFLVCLVCLVCFCFFFSTSTLFVWEEVFQRVLQELHRRPVLVRGWEDYLVSLTLFSCFREVHQLIPRSYLGLVPFVTQPFGPVL